MLFRRADEGPREVTNLGEARALAADIREHADRLRGTPGLLDGSLEEVQSTLERLMREYARLTRGRVGEFKRELDAVAERAEELEDAGRLSPRHAKLVNQALQHIRRVHFFNARKVLTKIGRALGGTRAWREAVETYRRYHRSVAHRAREAEDALERLRSVPRPPAAPEDVATARALVERCNRAADDAWSVQTHRPVTEAVADLVVHPDVEGLGLLSTQEFLCLRELGDLLEEDGALKDVLGPRPLSELVGASRYSVGKWKRVYPEAAHRRQRLQELFHQLRPVVTGTYGASFGIDVAGQDLARRLEAWRQFPGREEEPAWAGLDGLLAGERFSAIQTAARLYAQYGDLAERAWRGELEEEIEEREAKLAAARKELKRLPDPDGLAE